MIVVSSLTPAEKALVAALQKFIVSRNCPTYLRTAATAWLRGKV